MSADRAARERKQKIFVAVGGVLLLLILAIQVPKLMGGGSPEVAGTPTTSTGVETTAGTPTAAPAASAVSQAVPAVLVDTDRPFARTPGKLASLSAFKRKDPFVQQVKGATTTSTPTTSTGDGGKTGKSDGAAKTPSTGFTVGSPAAAVTVISVNGARQALVPGAAFPSANPIFVLVAEQVKSKTVTIGVAGGEYANGSRATKLKVGKPLVLVNTTTGERYKLVLVAVGNGSAAAKSAQGTGTAGTTPAKP
jgi:hypothetical protein